MDIEVLKFEKDEQGFISIYETDNNPKDENVFLIRLNQDGVINEINLSREELSKIVKDINSFLSKK